jgi:hypothetical protein
LQDVSQLRAALASRAEDAQHKLAGAAANSSGVARAVADACGSIATASSGLLAGVLENVERRMLSDHGRKFKRDAEWVALFLQLCCNVADAVDGLVEVSRCTSLCSAPSLLSLCFDALSSDGHRGRKR